MRTFEVSKVELATAPRKALDRDKAIADLLSVPAPAEPVKPSTDALEIRPREHPKRLSRIEQTYTTEARLVACTDVSPLVQLAHDAFCSVAGRSSFTSVLLDRIVARCNSEATRARTVAAITRRQLVRSNHAPS